MEWITFFFLVGVGALVFSENDRLNKRAHKTLDGLELALQQHREGAGQGDIALRIARSSGAFSRIRLETVAEIETAFLAIETGADDREEAIGRALASIIEARQALSSYGLG